MVWSDPSTRGTTIELLKVQENQFHHPRVLLAINRRPPSIEPTRTGFFKSVDGSNRFIIAELEPLSDGVPALLASILIVLWQKTGKQGAKATNILK